MERKHDVKDKRFWKVRVIATLECTGKNVHSGNSEYYRKSGNRA